MVSGTPFSTSNWFCMCQDSENPQRPNKSSPVTSLDADCYSFTHETEISSVSRSKTQPWTHLASCPFREPVFGCSDITVCGQLFFSPKSVWNQYLSRTSLLLTWKQMPFCCWGMPTFTFWRELSANSIIIPKKRPSEMGWWKFSLSNDDFFFLLLSKNIPSEPCKFFANLRQSAPFKWYFLFWNTIK